MITSVLLILLGFIFLLKGADFLIEGSSNISKKFGIPEIIIGLTIISIGTTMPEFFVSLTSALNNYNDMAIGNAIGSIICNLLLILGLTAIIQSIKLNRELLVFEIPFSILTTLIFLYMCNTDFLITKMEGIILILILILFIIYIIIREFKSKEEKADNQKQKLKDKTSALKDTLYIILGIVALRIGGQLTVNNAVTVAKYFNLSEKIIGVTILALGTSLPELFTCVTATIKKKSDIAIGNILGANILNILLIVGTSSIISSPIIFNPSYNKDIILIIFANILLEAFYFIPPKYKISRMNGILYFCIYLIYMISLFVN